MFTSCVVTSTVAVILLAYNAAVRLSGIPLHAQSICIGLYTETQLSVCIVYPSSFAAVCNAGGYDGYFKHSSAVAASAASSSGMFCHFLSNIIAQCLPPYDA